MKLAKWPTRVKPLYPRSRDEPRCPAQSALYQIVVDHFETFRLVRKGGFEPTRSCERQPLKLEPVNVDRSRPGKIEVGCPA